MTKSTQTTEKVQDRPELSNDTLRAIREIKANRAFPSWQTVGVGGWPEVYKFADDWKRYNLNIAGEETIKITAENDEAARAYFHARYSLNEVPYSIYEISHFERIIE